MTKMTYRVGDVVAWSEVPSGALVRVAPHGCYFMRLRERGHLIAFADGSMWESWAEMGDDEAPRWFGDGLSNGAESGAESVTVIAMGLTGEETAADLQRLAEVYEVREALVGMVLPSPVFEWEVRDALRAEQDMPPDGLYNATRPCGTTICGVEAGARPRSEMWHMKHCGGCRGEVADRLHAAGWRPSDSAERAAELFAAEGRR